MVKLLKVKEAAEKYRVDEKTMYNWLVQGKVPGIKIGTNTWRVPDIELEITNQKEIIDGRR